MSKPGFFIADDLSGALDAAGAFYSGATPVVTVMDFEDTTAWPESNVVAITTETRNSTPRDAARLVAQAVAAGTGVGRRLLFKKIDSTMRGPVAEELSALDAALPGMRWLFTPANPGAGRTVRDGVLSVHGVPVSETAFGRDPLSPVCSSSLREMLGAAATGRVTIVDAESDADLERAVKEMSAAGEMWVGVGSAALARAIVKVQGARSGPSHPLPFTVPCLPAKTLVVCGSAHEVSKAQALRMQHKRGLKVREIDAAAEPANGSEPRLDATVESVFRIRSERIDPKRGLEALIDAAAETIVKHDVRRVFATGGETAGALCRALGVRTLAYFEEMEPGVSLSIADAVHGRILLAVKPGGFGDEDAWVRVWDRLHRA